jgi:putative ABC transport system permease protein
LTGLFKGRPIEVMAGGAWQVSEMRREQIALYTRFLAIIGGVSLLVSSLGIANVMLAAVAERRREIGLRVALGAAPLDITVQFMVESVAICLVGGLAGLALAIGVAGLILTLVGYEVALSFGTLLVPALLAALCGLAAGVYPARLAARADPISSLQST